MQLSSEFTQLGQRGLPDLAFGRADRAQEGGVIIGIGDQSQPGHRVLDLAAIEERRAAGQVVGHAQHLQRLFQRLGLVVAAEQDGEVVPRPLVALLLEGDFGSDALGFLLVVVALDHADRRAVVVLAPQLLGMLVRVVGDHRIGGAQDAPRAAVVLLQRDDPELGEIATQAHDVFRIGAAPGVDRLVVVAHAGEVGLRPGQRLQQAVLGAVGVLVFVDQQVAQSLAPATGEVGVFLQQLQRQADQVVEIHGIESGQPPLVVAVDVGGLAFARALCGGRCAFGIEAFVLGAGDQRLHRFQRVAVRAFWQQVADLGGAVVGVEHGKAATQAGRLVLDLQDLQAHRVEGADRQAFGGVALDALRHALAHFLRRLVGEGDRRDVFRRHPPGSDQVRDLLGDDAGLAGARAGQHQHRSFGGIDGSALLRVEHVRVESGYEARVAGIMLRRRARTVPHSRPGFAPNRRRIRCPERPETSLRWPNCISIIRR